MMTNDRVLSIKPMEGKQSVSVTGLVDKRLFTGENKLHAIRGPHDSMWRLRYEAGLVPAPLQQSFTSFNLLMKVATDYFNKRNIEIQEIIP